MVQQLHELLTSRERNLFATAKPLLENRPSVGRKTGLADILEHFAQGTQRKQKSSVVSTIFLRLIALRNGPG
jgi:hypothetical protein